MVSANKTLRERAEDELGRAGRDACARYLVDPEGAHFWASSLIQLPGGYSFIEVNPGRRGQALTYNLIALEPELTKTALTRAEALGAIAEGY